MPTYKWTHPSEWLDERILRYAQQEDAEALAHIAAECASKLDGDQIQDLFQDEMDAEGYFRPLKTK